MRLRPWGSFFTLVSCWFAVCQLFLIIFVILLANKATLIPGTNTSVMAYIKDAQQASVIQSMQDKIALIDGVSHVKFIPRSEGLLRMKQWLGEDSPWMEGLDADILPDAFEINIKPRFAADVESLATMIRAIPGIEDVRSHTGLVGSIAGAYHTILIAGFGVALVIIACLGIVLFLSIRVGIMTRDKEIEVLNILGAKKSFLYAPYIIEAFCYGLVSSVLALITVRVFIRYITDHLPVLYAVIPSLDVRCLVVMTVFVCLFCVSSAVLVINRNSDA